MYTDDKFLGGKLVVRQPQEEHYRAGSDAVLLAASVRYQGGRVLDMGCGVGTVGLCLQARSCVENLVLLDCQYELIQHAVHNKMVNGLHNIECVVGDARFLPFKAHYFSHVICNPPYFEGSSPYVGRSLARHGTLTDMERWLREAWRVLEYRGCMWLSYPVGYADKLIAMLRAFQFGSICLYPFWPKKGQAAKRCIIRAVKNGKGAFQLLTGLTLHEISGEYTENARCVLSGGSGLSFE